MIRGWLFRRRLASDESVLHALAWGIAHEQGSPRAATTPPTTHSQPANGHAG